MKNQSLLRTSIKVLTRDYKTFFLMYFGIMTLIYVIEFMVAISSGTARIGGIEYTFFIACLVSGLSTFKENYLFLAQNQVPKPTIVKALILEGLFFGLVSSFAINIYFHLMLWISHILGFSVPDFLPLTPTGAEQGGLIGFCRTFIILFFLYVMTYFFGLLLSTINYRLNWWGRILFWVPFGILTLNNMIGSLEYVIENLAPEENPGIPFLTLAKPFVYILDWLLQSLGNFVIGSTVIIALCLVLGALIFRGAEIKYSTAN